MTKRHREMSRLSNLAICLMVVLIISMGKYSVLVQGEPGGTVSGRIVDEYDQGMGNVEIKVYSSEDVLVANESTSSDGSFSVDLGLGREYVLHISEEGYATFTKTILLRSQEPVDLGDIILLKALRLFYTVLGLVARPGDELVLPFTVSNIGEEAEVVELSVTKPTGWKMRILDQIGEVSKIHLLTGASLSLQLVVAVPQTSGGDYGLSLTATGKTSSTLDFTVTVDTGEIDYTETSISCSEPWQVASTGSVATFDLMITNNVKDDIYLLYIENPSLPNKNWTTSFYSDIKNVKSVGIEALQKSLITLLVEVPSDAAPHDYSFRVYASGTYSISSMVLTITVRRIPRGIDLVYPFQSKTALTGQSLSYPIKVVNEGEQSEKIFLGINRTSDMMIWDISFSEDELTLPSKGAEWITLSIKPPDIVKAGKYTMNITASTEDGELKTNIPIVTEIVANYLLEIVDIQPISPEVATGEKIDVLVTARNMGQSPLTRVRLNVSSIAIPNIFTTPVDVLALEPMSSVTFFVSISPGTHMTPGNYQIEIRASSVETQSNVRAFVVSIVSPIPWFWITIAVTIIATSLAIIAIERLISKYGIRFRVRR